MSARAAAVLGLAPHSGWAAAVLLTGTPAQPLVLRRERLELADAHLSGSRQPYHALASLPLPAAQQRLARYCSCAAALAQEALGALVAGAQAAGIELQAVGILDATGTRGAPLASILASHALIHSADGEHFRAALAQAGEALGLRIARIRERDLRARAGVALQCSPQELAARLKALGRAMGPPWGADQKSAALLAWFMLSGGA